METFFPTVVHPMRLDGYRLTNNPYTLGPEALRGSYKPVCAESVVGLNHSLLLMPSTWSTRSLISRLKVLPPIHLASPYVPNCFNEMQTYMYLNETHKTRPHVAVHVNLNKEMNRTDRTHRKVYNTHYGMGLGMYKVIKWWLLKCVISFSVSCSYAGVYFKTT